MAVDSRARGVRRVGLALAVGAALLASAALGPGLASAGSTSAAYRLKAVDRAPQEHRVASLRASNGARPATSSLALPQLRLPSSVERAGRANAARWAATAAATGTHAANGHTATSGASSITPRVTIAGSVVSVSDRVGLGMAESGNVEPADPWVTDNASYVIQVVNSMVRISTRSGGTLISVPTAALYTAPPSYLVSDSRIIWDATHGRWVGEAVIFPDDGQFLDNYLAVAVSESADPTGAWRVILYPDGTVLPDFPGLASSGDKIVTSTDLFVPSQGNAFGGIDVETLTWSSILSGGALTGNGCNVTDLAHGRPAQVLTAGNDVNVVAEDASGGGTTGDQVYFRVTNAGTCANLINFQDLSTSIGFEPFDMTVPEPRQTGSDTIANAVDERPTDSVWRSSTLWWVATRSVSYDAGATFNDEVAVYSIHTPASAASSATAGDIFRIDPGDGIDAFMGGIGLTGNGIPIITYSQGSDTDPITWWANRGFTGGTLGSPLLLGTSDAAYGGERWGDYAGVSTDPAGTGAVWTTHMLAASDGSWRTQVDRLLVDTDNPSTPGAPGASPLVPQTIATARYRIAWGGSTDSSGVVTYQLEQSVDGSAFGYVTQLAGTSTYRTLSIGHTYRFRVLAIDLLGKLSGYATGPTIQPLLGQSASSKTGTWHVGSAVNYSGGTVLYTTSAGATASYTSTAVRSLGFVTTKGAAYGSFRIYVDNVLKATISAHATTTTWRQLVYQITFSSPGTHTLKVVVLGTSGHPRVDIDAFLVLK